MLRLVTLARTALRAARWFAFATIGAGLVVFVSMWDASEPSRAGVLLVLCLAPGLVLLHLTSLLASLPARIRLGPGMTRGLLIGIGITYLFRPWYWLAVGLSFASALVLLPLAILVLLGVA